MPAQANDSRRAEAKIIRELQRGDATHFQTLYQMHSRRVFSLCLRMVRNHDLAEDLTQETFLTVFRRIGTFRGESAFSTWLHRLAVNVVFMYLRQQKSRISEVPYEDFESDDDTPVERHGDVDRVLTASEDRITLQRAIDALPPGYRVVFVLHDVEGYEHREIAELLGCSPGNTKSQLHKARMKLRRVLVASEAVRVRRSTAATRAPATARPPAWNSQVAA